MKKNILRALVGAATLVGLLALASCAPTATASGKKTIVVTYSILGDLVSTLAGEAFEVKVSMPNGLDPHEWEPSARDIETLNKAALIVRNGLGLEGGMEKALAATAAAGVPQFVASDHIAVRTVKEGQGLPGDDPDQAVGAQDPHLWLDPQRMKSVVLALAADIKARFDIDLSAKADALAAHLDTLHANLVAQVASLPAARRVLVTGHESLGYFAEAYGFTLVGAIVPSLSTTAEVSASDLAALKATLTAHPVPVIFTELGTPPKVAQTLAQELGVRAVEITTHNLPATGGYDALMTGLMTTIVTSLKG